MTPLQLWAGPESSCVRVGDRVTDQLHLSGFANRPDNLDRLASLGVARVRFPVLWERTAPEDGEADWRWADASMRHLRELGVAPIAGLVHHGGGPLPGGLLDPGFAEGLARFAGQVARRYPWLDAYTPVNEPLTTARFAALYGVWHPHGRSDEQFLKALLAELRGTVLSMQSVREVRPDAALIQTEDMGKVYGTPAVRHQVDFENLRRWLSFDLLCGRVDEHHGLWDYLRWAGGDERELLWFAEHPCPPDVLGLNLYPTSERWLDDRLEQYPAHLHGGNPHQRYADVEAVRVRPELPGSFYERLMEAHERYHRPLAITEAHLGCTREEQLRWLLEAWRGAEHARQGGADVRAVTAWAAFGSHEWASLMTQSQGHYESGLWDTSGWDTSGGAPRETALVTLARELAAGQQPSHPVLAGPGWWRRAERRHRPGDRELTAEPIRGQPVQIMPGPLAGALERLCFLRGVPVWHAGDPAPWACLRSSTPDTLELHWQGREPLTVRAGPLGVRELNAALDLLMDGESGLWQWTGSSFQPAAGSPIRGEGPRPLRVGR